MDKNRKSKLCFGDSLYSKEEKIPFIVEGLLGVGDIALVHGKKGIGKSLFAMQLQCNCTTQTPFLDSLEIHKKNRVLWLQGESTHYKYDKRILNMSKCIPLDDEYRYFMNCKRLYFNVDTHFEYIMSELAKPQVKYDVIVLDSLYNFVSGSKNSDEVVSKWTSNFDSLCDEFGASCIALGHTGKDSHFQTKGGVEVVEKGSSAKGAVEWDAYFSIIYELKEIDKKKHILRLIKHKDRDGECVETLTYRMIVPQTDKLGRLMLTTDVDDKAHGLNQMKISTYLKMNKEPFTAQEISEAIDMSMSSLYYSVKKCIQEKDVEKYVDDAGRTVFQTTSPT